MAIQLTPEQEQRIQAIVRAGEIASARSFEASLEELEGLLLEGSASKELSEEEFWNSVDCETNAMLVAHQPLSRA